MTDPLTINLNGLIIDGQTPDPDGTVWSALKFDGWWDPPTTTVTTGDVTPIGQTVTIARFEARAIAAEFLAHHALDNLPLVNGCFSAIQRLKRAIDATLIPVPMLVNDPLLALRTQVRLNTGMKIAIQGDRGMVDFSVPILCPDPRRYAQATTLQSLPITGTGTDSGGVTIVNNGDMESPPVVTIYGPATNPSIQNDSIAGTPHVKWNATLGSSDVLVINMNTCTVVRNGSQNMIVDLDPNSRFWQMQPGANVIHYHCTSAPGPVTVANVVFRDAYS